MLFQSKTAKRRSTPPVAYQAGMVALAVFEHTFTTAFTAATDILEIGLLPAGAKIVRTTLIPTNMVAATLADVGLMTGEAGEYDETRTSGNQIFNDVAATGAEKQATMVNLLAITPDETHRGIGVTLSLNQGASPTRKLTIVIEYTY